MAMWGLGLLVGTAAAVSVGRVGTARWHAGRRVRLGGRRLDGERLLANRPSGGRGSLVGPRYRSADRERLTAGSCQCANGPRGRSSRLQQRLWRWEPCGGVESGGQRLAMGLCLSSPGLGRIALGLEFIRRLVMLLSRLPTMLDHGSGICAGGRRHRSIRSCHRLCSCQSSPARRQPQARGDGQSRGARGLRRAVLRIARGVGVGFDLLRHMRAMCAGGRRLFRGRASLSVAAEKT